jgi:hypothetical protein
MTVRVPVLLKAVSLTIFAVLTVSCSAERGPAASPTTTATSPPTSRPTLTRTPRPATLTPPPSEIKLTVLHTNDSRGYVDPCG